ncbi:16S rRNA (guanine(527)-N(7))-methyltransferase RsmG [Tropicimonas sp.]|uniref:16S rRNA (guanine(527)-N(7))-methyltransferase RsmG n=1 Tax=Tropicimonas sp. TaxID=2067044 RepID=UPI003A863621
MRDPSIEIARVVGRDVSRETMERLNIHLALLKQWNPTINLVAPSTIAEGWARHIIDSAQIIDMTDVDDGGWLDIGSGGGFPGLVCAILAFDYKPALRFTLVESDKRKAAFLATVVRNTDIPVNIESKRIETLPPQAAQVISARALAPLDLLLKYAEPHLVSNGICIFPKGSRYSEEVDRARQGWRFKLDTKPSITDPKAAILLLGDIERA